MYCKVYALAVCLCCEMKKPACGATTFLAMKSKLKHFFMLSAITLVAISCGSSMAQPVSGLDVTLIPARMLSIAPKNTEQEIQTEAPLRLSKSQTTNRTSTVNH